MKFVEIGAFEVVHLRLTWPWVAIDASGTRFAFASAPDRVATRVLVDGRIDDGPSFSLGDLALPSEAPDPASHVGVAAGVHGFSLDRTGALLAVTGVVDRVSVVVTVGLEGELRRTNVEAFAQGYIAHAVAFDRSGTRLWLSAENGEHTALMLLDARSHELLGLLLSDPFPPPANHELHVHPQDDAVLLLAACGQDGTFARVAGFTDGPPVALGTALDAGAAPAGFVGFSLDGARAHFAEDEALRTHSWPGLIELSSVPFADEFASAYSGIVLRDRILVDGNDVDTEDDDVMSFDRTGVLGMREKPPVPSGMWVGRLGQDLLLTVASKGDPASGKVFRIPAPLN